MTKGTRLPQDWTPTPDLWNFATGMGFSATEIEKIVAEFVDYWSEVPGHRGLKIKWEGAFRNRVRAVAERRGFNRPSRQRRETVIDIANDLSLGLTPAE